MFVSSKFAPKGGLPREVLIEAVAAGLTLAQIAARTERSIATVRYWLTRHGIERERAGRRSLASPDAPRELSQVCPSHGATDFVLEGRGYYRCKLCRQERVTEWRRRVKRLMVEEAGGCCQVCGYADCVAALQFHHLNPSIKRLRALEQGAGTLARADPRRGRQGHPALRQLSRRGRGGLPSVARVNGVKSWKFPRSRAGGAG